MSRLLAFVGAPFAPLTEDEANKRRIVVVGRKAE